MKKLNFIFAIYLMPVLCFAQEVIQKTGLENTLDKIANAIPVEGTVVSILAVILELALRLFKTSKPLSILHIISGTLKSVATICSKVADLLDRILPQNTVENKEVK